MLFFSNAYFGHKSTSHYLQSNNCAYIIKGSFLYIVINRNQVELRPSMGSGLLSCRPFPAWHFIYYIWNEKDAVEFQKWRTEVSEVGCLHVTGLLFEDGCAATRERVHVSRDGADGHMTRAGRLQDRMVIPWRRVGRHYRACWEEKKKKTERTIKFELELINITDPCVLMNYTGYMAFVKLTLHNLEKLKSCLWLALGKLVLK